MKLMYVEHGGLVHAIEGGRIRSALPKGTWLNVNLPCLDAWRRGQVADGPATCLACMMFIK